VVIGFGPLALPSQASREDQDGGPNSISIAGRSVALEQTQGGRRDLRLRDDDGIESHGRCLVVFGTRDDTKRRAVARSVSLSVEPGLNRGNFPRMLKPSLIFLGLLSLGGCRDAAETSLVAEELPIATAETAIAGEWSLFRGDSALTGESSEVLPAPLTLAWKLEMIGPIVATAAIANESVFVGSQDGDFRAIDLESGKEKWMKQLGDTLESSACILDGVVYVGSGDGALYALNAETGEEIWKYQTEGEILGGVNFLRHEDKTLLYVGSYDNFLHCVDAETGKGLWKAETGNYVNGTPAVAEGKVMFGGCDAILYMVDAVTGEPGGEIEIGSYVANSIAVKDGIAYLAHYGNQAEAYSLADKKQLWVFQDRNFPYFASPAVTDDTVYVADRGKRLYALNRKDGTEKWAFKARRSIDSSPVISGELLYVGSDDGRLYGIALEDGGEVWSYEIGEAITAAPAIASEHLVVGALDGFVYAFKAAKP